MVGNKNILSKHVFLNNQKTLLFRWIWCTFHRPFSRPTLQVLLVNSSRIRGIRADPYTHLEGDLVLKSINQQMNVLFARFLSYKFTKSTLKFLKIQIFFIVFRIRIFIDLARLDLDPNWLCGSGSGRCEIGKINIFFAQVLILNFKKNFYLRHYGCFRT
jgi:hypothetical protein